MKLTTDLHLVRRLRISEDLLPLSNMASGTALNGMQYLCRDCCVYGFIHSGVPRNFVPGGGSTNSIEDRENGDLGAVAP